jgi:hypothetical protein
VGRSTPIIAHLPSIEVTDDDPRQAVQRLPPCFLRQHRPEARQLDPFRGYAARGGMLAGWWKNTILLLEYFPCEIAVATPRVSATRPARRLPDEVLIGKL